MKASAQSALVPALLCLFAVYCGWPATSLIVDVWNEGNTIYPSFAWNQSSIPNVDFVCGYPGLFFWLQAKLFAWTGSDLHASNRFGLFWNLISSLFLYLLVRDFGRPLLAALGFLVTFGVTFLAYPSGGSGYPMAASVSIGLFLISRAFGPSKGRGACLVGGAFFVGLSLSFKQSGIFAAVALGQILLIWLVGSRRWLAAAVSLLPIVAFLALRLRGPLLETPANAVILLAWPLAQLVFLRWWRSSGDVRPHAFSGRELAWALVALASGALVWMLLYPWPVGRLTLLHELYQRVPALIDRDLPAISVVDWTCFTAAFLVMAAIVLRRAGSVLAVAPMVLSVAIILLVLLFSSYPTSAPVGFATSVRAVSPMFWDNYVLVSILAALVSAAFVARPTLLDARKAVVFALAVTQLTSAFPYPGNMRYAMVPLAVLYLSLTWAWGKEHRAPASVRRLGSLMLGGLLLATVAEWMAVRERLREVPRAEWRGLGPPLGFVKPQEAGYAEAAVWLRENSAAEAKLGGYPDMAFTLAMAERPAADPFPNFIGDQDGFAAIRKNLQNGHYDYYLLRAAAGGTPGDAHYFQSSGLLGDSLRKSYDRVADFPLGPGDRLEIYRRR